MHNHSHPSFDKQTAKKYDQNSTLMAPIFENLYYLIKAVLNDLATSSKILCVGAGTGSEIVELAKAFPGFTFVGVDPSDSMLEVCRSRLNELKLLDRCKLVHGYLQDIPETDEFDAALCLLVAHHTSKDGSDRQKIFSGVSRRLKPNGYFISAEVSVDTNSNTFQDIMKKWQSLARRNGSPEEKVQHLPQMMMEHLSILSPSEIESLFMANGFGAPVQFFQSLLIRAWYAQK
jgi:tRNA (cmo5U34)-methyltransferase